MTEHYETRRRIITVLEHETLEMPVSDLFKEGKVDLYPEVTGTKYFTFYLKQNSFVFQAGGYVGHIPINDRIMLDVRPRVPVKNLARIWQLTNIMPETLDFHLRNYATDSDAPASLIDILANALVAGIADIKQNGLHKEYIRHTADTSFPRGRIMISDTVLRHLAKGRSHTIAASWFEHSTDTAPNRCIKYAIWLLAQRYHTVNFRKGERKLISDLNRSYQLFARVSLDRSRSFLKDPMVRNPDRLPTLRAYYAPLLQIAVSIIENRGVSFDEKDTALPLHSLIFDFDQVFEQYLLAILRERLDSEIRVTGKKEGAKPLFDTSSSRLAEPDIVVRIGDQYPLLIEVKYKPVKTPERPDLNQAITYGFSYRCKNVVLAHPKKEDMAGGLRLLGTIKDYNFYQYAFDLGNEDPEDEEGKFAETMAKLISSAQNIDVLGFINNQTLQS